jgi:hypothetical protein
MLAEHWGLHGLERGVLTRHGFNDLTRTRWTPRGEHGEGVATRPELNLCREHGEVVVTSTEFARLKGARTAKSARAAKGRARRSKLKPSPKTAGTLKTSPKKIGTLKPSPEGQRPLQQPPA